MLSTGLFGYLLDYLLWWVLFASVVVHTWCFFRFFPRRWRKTRLVAGNVLIFLCLLGAAALAGESYFRFIAIETDSFGVSLPARRWFALHTRLNALGCRDEERTQSKPPGVRRIVFVGDSFLYGWGIKDPRNRFPDRIQARFGSTSPGAVEIINVAKPGWGTGDQIQPVKDMVKVYAADEIVLCYVANDIEKLLPTQAGFNPTRPPQPTLVNVDASALLDYLYRRVYLPRVPTVRGYHDWLADGYADPQTWRRQQQQMEAMVAACQEGGATLRVVLLPFLRTQGARFDPQVIHMKVRDFFVNQGIEVLDLVPAIAGLPPETLVVNDMDAHPNERAHALFADAVWNAWYASDSAPLQGVSSGGQ